MSALLALADDDALRRWESLSLGYVEHNQGSLFLRDEIARQYEAVGPEQINVCAPQEGIYLAMRALLAPGDRVVVTSPCYQSLSEVARHIGCEVRRWEPPHHGGSPPPPHGGSTPPPHGGSTPPRRCATGRRRRAVVRPFLTVVHPSPHSGAPPPCR